MNLKLPGIHHVTAIAGDPQQNVDFYTSTLGLRLVKRTINFDDPSAYHLYYGNEAGNPGTILTFFSWPRARRGRRGAGQVTAAALSIPPDSMSYWVDRLKSRGLPLSPISNRFDEEVLSLVDPDGLLLELIASPITSRFDPWEGGAVPPEKAIRGLHSVTLTEDAADPTSHFMESMLAFTLEKESQGRFRFSMSEPGSAATVDLQVDPKGSRGAISIGTVHHVAWRTSGDEEQRGWREKITGAGTHVSPVMDRQYFHSIYFREPGGILFEIATDPPGFTVNETPAELGSSLVLPPWLESHRRSIEAALPSLRTSSASSAKAGS
ncbi:MAG TPA: ring-cleaving dioxygenase [Terriglobia bacterium]|nr:ring-cleaving dioxygenase [Terriglobia bacterium]